MKYFFARRNSIVAILIMLILLTMSCASMNYLKTEKVSEADIRSRHTVSLFGI